MIPKIYTPNQDWRNDQPTEKQVEILGFEPKTKGEASTLIKKLKQNDK